MPSIKITPSTAYPSIPDIGDTLESHSEALQAIADSLETGERRDGHHLESFITFQELIDLDIIDDRGELVVGGHIEVPKYTTAQIVDKTHAVNTSPDKNQGSMIYNSTTGKPLWADGSTNTSTWSDATGTPVHTPV